MTRWLARFSFSAIVIAFVLAWEGYKLMNRDDGQPQWRWMLCFVGAGVLLSLGAAGIRARHRDQH